MSKVKYYVGVNTNHGLSLVDYVDDACEQCSWFSFCEPLEFTLSRAIKLCSALSFNGYDCVVVRTFRKYEKQPFIIGENNDS